MLRRIILENFMSHARTEIDLADGLTVLTGPNNCGKSAVVAALQILATNGRTTHVMRHGATRCRVTVETDDGHVVCWERNKKTVKYTIDGEDIHRVGASIPEQLHDILRLDRVQAETGKSTNEYDIHFGEQKAPIFLLGESGSRAASFFASSSDASRLVEMQHLHRNKVREQRSASRQYHTEFAEIAARLKAFQPVDALAARLTDAEQQQTRIQTVHEQTVHLARIIVRYQETLGRCQRLQAQQSVLSRLDQGKTTTKDLEDARQQESRLQTLILQLTRRLHHQRQWIQRNRALEPLRPVPVLHAVDILRELIQQLGAAASRRQLAEAVLRKCRVLTPPPELHPESDCRRLLNQWTDTESRRRRLTTECRRLQRLTPPPAFQDTAALHSLVGKMQLARRKHDAASRTTTTLRPLCQPPAPTDTERLRQMIRQLVRLSAGVGKWQQVAGMLGAVSEPPTVASARDLQQTIDQLVQKHSAVDQARRAAEQAERDRADCADAIRAFVAENPRCATCGALIEPEALLSHQLPETAHHHSVAEADVKRGKEQPGA
jgi:hypothetical protein